MPTIRRILCPVDFSGSSERALDVALGLARRHEASVSVLHVLADVFADAYPYVLGPIAPDDETRARAREHLESFARRDPDGRVDVGVLLGEGDIVSTVIEQADEMAADLIVLGTQGRRGLAHLLLGSVTERVLRQAMRPVLSVSPRMAAPSEDGAVFDKILCPVDFSPSSLAAYRFASSLAGDRGTVTLLHVVEFYVDASIGEAIAFDLADVRERHRSEAMEKLEQAAADAPRDRTRLEVASLASLGTHREILRFAEEDGSHAIVMGVVGRGAFDMFLFGSTANHVVRSATCPVVTVRAEG